MKNILYLITIGTLLITYSCIEDSVLSDEEISNPKLIAPDIQITRTIGIDSILESDIQVWIFDKNKNTVKIKNGYVRLNGTEMDIKNLALGDGSYYSSENFLNEVEPDTEYFFEIELPTGNIYNASITTQEKEINQIILPDSHDHTKDLEVSWKEIVVEYEMNISAIIYYKNDTAKGNAFYNDEIPPSSAKIGKWIIPKEEFNINNNEVYKITVTISTSKNGNIDSDFYDNRKIQSIFSVKGKCYLY